MLLTRLRHTSAAGEEWVWLGTRPLGEQWKRRANRTRRDDGVLWNWQMLRQTSATYVSAMVTPQIESLRLGHSQMVAERHYYGAIRELDRTVIKTLEQAMDIVELAREIATGT